MGLFVMVGALVHVGVIERLGTAATDAVGDHYFVAATGAALRLRRAVRDRRQHPVRRHDGAAGGRTSSTRPAATRRPTRCGGRCALGADLGGNATAVGASANVVVIGIAARNGHPISFWKFTKYGIVVTAVTVTLCWPYLWLRYYM